MSATAPRVSKELGRVSQSSESPNQRSSLDTLQSGEPDHFSGGQPQTVQDNRAQERTSRSRSGAPIAPSDEQQNTSAHKWDSWSLSRKALLGLIVTLLFGIAAWIYQSRADKSAEQASRATAEGNKLAAESIRIALWELCKSEEAFQNTTTCIELMTNGPFSLEKRGLFLRICTQDLQFPEDLEIFTHHHELLMYLMTRWLQLGRELYALHNNTEPGTQDRIQLRHIADSMLASESQILALLSLIHLSVEAEENAALTKHQDGERAVSVPQNLKSPLYPEDCRRTRTASGYKKSAPLDDGRIEDQDSTQLEHISTDTIQCPTSSGAWYPFKVLTVDDFINMCLLTSLCWSLSMMSYFWLKTYLTRPRAIYFLDYLLQDLGILDRGMLQRRVLVVYLCLVISSITIGLMLVLGLLGRYWVALMVFTVAFCLFIGCEGMIATGYETQQQWSTRPEPQFLTKYLLSTGKEFWKWITAHPKMTRPRRY